MATKFMFDNYSIFNHVHSVATLVLWSANKTVECTDKTFECPCTEAQTDFASTEPPQQFSGVILCTAPNFN